MSAQRRRLFRDEAFVRRGRTEPIDGLLRITAPHEWLFLALLGCALIGVLVWAVFGTVERGISAPCVVVAEDGSDLHAVAWLATDDARHITVGMSAGVSPLGAGGSLDAVVSEVGLEPSELPTSSRSPDDDRTPLVRIDLLEPALAPIGNGHACDVRIVTRREAPLRLIAAVGLG